MNMPPAKVFLCLVWAVSLVTDAAGLEEAEIKGELGAGHSFVFDLQLMSHTGDAMDHVHYTGGDPGCCENCVKSNDPARWGRTELYNYKYDGKYDTNICKCFTGPRTREGKAKLRSIKDGYATRYCGSNSTFLEHVDGHFGEGTSIAFRSAEKVGYTGWPDPKNSEECCERCSNEFPEIQMSVYDMFTKMCYCYKAITGKRPEIYGQGTYNGVCHNE